MNSLAYEAMKAEMAKGTYTEIEAKETLTTMYAQKMLTADEYTELMEAAARLNANTSEGEWRNSFTALEERVKKNEEEIALIKKALEDGEIVVPEPEPGADGTEFNPITAYRGMNYYPGLYYTDPEDNQVYKCRDDRGDVTEAGVRLDYLPHELVNIYFYFVRVE